MPERTYYEILDLEATATLEEITESYRLHTAAWHPDRHTVSNKQRAEDKMKQINEAYRVLSNATLRRQYDAALRKKSVVEVAEVKPAPAPVSNPVQVPGTGVQLESDIYDKIALLLARGQTPVAAQELAKDMPNISNAKVWEVLDCIKARRFRR
ncbi:MAG: DnaJ domain-containing protein [Abitibacteriaceae bacterium]|nr:DnaJ domain-containing protein [Abditibacteriaceae bacterium]